MVITRPQLPARAGYVEIINENGEHVYKPTQETIDRQNQENLILELQNRLVEANSVIDAMIGVKEQEVATE